MPRTCCCLGTSSASSTTASAPMLPTRFLYPLLASGPCPWTRGAHCGSWSWYSHTSGRRPNVGCNCVRTASLLARVASGSWCCGPGSVLAARLSSCLLQPRALELHPCGRAAFAIRAETHLLTRQKFLVPCQGPVAVRDGRLDGFPPLHQYVADPCYIAV